MGQELSKVLVTCCGLNIKYPPLLLHLTTDTQLVMLLKNSRSLTGRRKPLKTSSETLEPCYTSCSLMKYDQPTSCSYLHACHVFPYCHVFPTVMGKLPIVKYFINILSNINFLSCILSQQHKRN